MARDSGALWVGDAAAEAAADGMAAPVASDVALLEDAVPGPRVVALEGVRGELDVAVVVAAENALTERPVAVAPAVVAEGALRARDAAVEPVVVAVAQLSVREPVAGVAPGLGAPEPDEPASASCPAGWAGLDAPVDWAAAYDERLKNIQTPFGRTVKVNYYSHDFYPMENGHVILLCQEFLDVEVNGQQTRVMGDALVDLDEQFNPVWVWSIFDVLDVNRHPYLWEPSHDWTHCNAVQPTPDGNLMLSVRNQSWVFKIDYADGTGSGQVLWKLGFEGDFALQDEGPADWFFAQHYPHILGTQGTNITSITVVDNGNYRPGTDPPPFSRGLIVEIDETQKVAQVVWQFPISPDFFSYWGGNVVRLPNGNMEICMSRPSPLHSTAFEVDFATREVLWQMDIAPPFAYRSYRIPSLYPGVQW